MYKERGRERERYSLLGIPYWVFPMGYPNTFIGAEKLPMLGFLKKTKLKSDSLPFLGMGCLLPTLQCGQY